MRLATVVILSALLATPAAAAASQDPVPGAVAESDVQAFRRLRAEGVAAAGAQDLTTAAARLAEADARIPNHSGLVLLRARVAALAGRRMRPWRRSGGSRGSA